MKNIPFMKLQSAITECEAHQKKLIRSLGLLKEFFPLTAESFQKLDEMQLEHVDQFIYRFSKQQDAIGIRLYPALYRIIEQDDKPRPFLDILRKLEKYGVIKEEKTWQFFRNLRNNFAHEYPDNQEPIIDTLNILYNRWSDFEEFYHLAKEYADKNHLLHEGSSPTP